MKITAQLNRSTQLTQTFSGIRWQWRGFNGVVGCWTAVDSDGNVIPWLWISSTGDGVLAGITRQDSAQSAVSVTDRHFVGNHATVTSRRDSRYFDAMEWASAQFIKLQKESMDPLHRATVEAIETNDAWEVELKRAYGTQAGAARRDARGTATARLMHLHHAWILAELTRQTIIADRFKAASSTVN